MKKWDFERLCKLIDAIYTGLKLRLLDGEALGLSPGATYYFIMGFVPFLLFIVNVVLFSMASQLDTVLHLVEMYLPVKMATSLNDYIAELVEQRSGFWTWVSLVVSLWSFENGMGLLVRATDFETYKQGGWLNVLLHVKSVLYSFGLVLTIMISLGFTVFGNAIMQYLKRYYELPGALVTVWEFGIYIVPFVVLVLLFMLFYRSAPHSYRPGWWPSFLAAFLAALLWIGFTSIYGFLMIIVPTMGEAYGSLIGLFVLFIWFRMVANIIIVGQCFLYAWEEYKIREATDKLLQS